MIQRIGRARKQAAPRAAHNAAARRLPQHGGDHPPAVILQIQRPVGKGRAQRPAHGLAIIIHGCDAAKGIVRLAAGNVLRHPAQGGDSAAQRLLQPHIHGVAAQADIPQKDPPALIQQQRFSLGAARVQSDKIAHGALLYYLKLCEVSWPPPRTSSRLPSSAGST